MVKSRRVWVGGVVSGGGRAAGEEEKTTLMLETDVLYAYVKEKEFLDNVNSLCKASC